MKLVQWAVKIANDDYKEIFTPSFDREIALSVAIAMYGQVVCGLDCDGQIRIILTEEQYQIIDTKEKI